MQMVFVSNFFNHHQEPLSLALFELLDENYWFIATEKIPEERRNMGYVDMNDRYSFVLRSYESRENEKKANQLINESDVVIYGSAPESMVISRIKAGKVTLAYTERLFKQGLNWKNYLRKWLSIKRHFERFKAYEFYVLCASAYTADDINKFTDFTNKTFRWGYFPETKRYDIEDLMKKKSRTTIKILWTGRLIKWKHPELAIKIAEQLNREGLDFELNIIGTGELKKELEKLVVSKKLEKNVHLLGAMSSESVRNYMEGANIFIFTSDQNEGWGAVLNESMNSGCAVVACDVIGSVPFLLKNGKNGFTYALGDFEKLYNCVKILLLDEKRRISMGIAAYNTIVDVWNSGIAAQNLVELSKCLINKQDYNKNTLVPCGRI